MPPTERRMRFRQTDPTDYLAHAAEKRAATRRGLLDGEQRTTPNATRAAESRMRSNNMSADLTRLFVNIGALLQTAGETGGAGGGAGDITAQVRDLYNQAAQNMTQPYGRILASNRCADIGVYRLNHQIRSLVRAGAIDCLSHNDPVLDEDPVDALAFEAIGNGPLFEPQQVLDMQPPPAEAAAAAASFASPKPRLTLARLAARIARPTDTPSMQLPQFNPATPSMQLPQFNPATPSMQLPQFNPATPSMQLPQFNPATPSPFGSPATHRVPVAIMKPPHLMMMAAANRKPMHVPSLRERLGASTTVASTTVVPPPSSLLVLANAAAARPPPLTTAQSALDCYDALIAAGFRDARYARSAPNNAASRVTYNHAAAETVLPFE